MIQIDTPFRWTGNTERAAELAAEDRLDDAAIAAECGVKRNTLARWRRHPEFHTRIAEHVTAQRAAIKAEGIANRQNRIARLNEDWQRMQALRDARAASATGEAPGEAPGVSTGLLVRQETSSRNGTVIEYAFDRALMTELRAHEEQAAKELGQWTEKRELTGKDGAPIEVKGSGNRSPVDPAEVAQVLAILGRAGALSGVPNPDDLQPADADGAADSLPADEPA